MDSLIFEYKFHSDSIPGEFSCGELKIEDRHNAISQDLTIPSRSGEEKPRQPVYPYNPDTQINSSKYKSNSIRTGAEGVNLCRSSKTTPIASENSQSPSSKYGFGELNCGVIGGRDYKFLNEFAAWSLDLFNKNLGKFDSEFLKYNKNFINAYFEQYLLYRFICHAGKAFSCIYENDPRDLYQRDFFLPVNYPSKIMTHFILNLKVKYSLEIELSLRFNHPEMYSRINDLIDRNVL